MSLDVMLESFYIVSSLWAGAGPRVCASNPVPPQPALEATWSSLPERRADITAFVDVNVVPMDTERVLSNHTVLVEGGRITALGPAATVKIPEGAVRVDGRGKYLMPGLGSMHAHFTYKSFTELAETDDELIYRWLVYLANGITTLRNPNDVSMPDREINKRLKATLGPRFYIAADLWSWLKSSPLDSIGPRIAAIYQTGEYDHIEAPSLFATHRAVYDSVMAAARRLGLSVSLHRHDVTLEEVEVLGANGGSIEHAHHLLRDVMKVQDPEQFASELRKSAAVLQKTGIWITVTMVCRRGSDRLDRVVKGLHDAGVGLLLGLDIDGPSRTPGLVHWELDVMVQAGLTPYQALVTGTRNVAQHLKRLDSSGTVAVGKWADLVLLHGNPLDDVRYTREPAGVMINGRWVARAELDQRLLAFPTWFELEIENVFFPARRTTLKPHFAAFRAARDSLAAAPPSAGAASERFVKRMAEELGAIRARLEPGEQAWVNFDAKVRVWLREQARKGYRVEVPGVSP